MQTILSEKEESEFAAFLQRQLRAFNTDRSAQHAQIRQPGEIVPLNLILMNEDGSWAGGLAARTYWHWLDIDDIFVAEELRGKGIGSALLVKAESIAARRGCTASFLTTFEFQARIFYEKQGYRVVGTLDDYPPGSAKYWLRKDFSRNE